MRRPYVLVAALFAIVAPLQAHATNFIVNGSFEADPFTSNTPGQKLGLVGNDVTGWFIPSSDGTYPWGLQNSNPYGAGPAADGNQWFVLGEVGTSVDYTIQQTITGLTPGDLYTLSFAFASEQGCCSVGEVSFLSGSPTLAQAFTAPSSGSYWTAWVTNSMNFLANNSSVTLQFKDLALEFQGGIDLGLDNVSVTEATAVPLPAALPLFVSGLAGLGWLARRKKRMTASSA